MDDYLEFAKKLAYQAGDIMLKHFKVGVERKYKEDNTPLTIADTTINNMVIEEVEKAFPDHAILGEEASLKKDSEYTWVVDPIDGTIPFSKGVPTNMFSLALVHKGLPIMAVLYDPYSKRLYESLKQRGAYLNGIKICVNDYNSNNIQLSFVGKKFGLANNGSFIKDAFDNDCFIFSFLCITYESMLVATGQIEGSIFHGKTPWDIAAVKLIVEEAGGKVTDIQGNEQDYDKPINGAIISNGLLHQHILDLVKPSLK